MNIPRPATLAAILSFVVVAAVHGESALKIELRGPRGPLAIAQSQFDTLQAVAEANDQREALRKSWSGRTPTKAERLKMRSLDAVVEKGRKTIQGIALKLHLTNTGRKPLTIPYGPDTSSNLLQVKGPKAINLVFEGAMTMEFRQPKPTILAPGASKEFPIPELRYGTRDMSRWLIAAPGTYTVTLQLATRLQGRKVELTSNDLTLKVKVTGP